MPSRGWVLVAVVAFQPSICLAGWETFTSKPGQFSISMPSKPEERAGSEENKAGKVPLRVLFATPQGLDAAFMVKYAVYPKAYVDKTGAKAILNETRDRLVQETKGKLESDKEIMLDKHPGREIEIHTDDATHRIKLLVVGQKLYYLITVGPKGRLAEESKQFFDSFKLVP